MTKQTLTALLLFLFTYAAQAQVKLFHASSNQQRSDKTEHLGLKLSKSAITQLFEASEKNCSITLPLPDGKVTTLKLHCVSDKNIQDTQFDALHFQGTVDKEAQSLVALSIYEQYIYGIIETRNGTWEVYTVLDALGNPTGDIEIREVSKTSIFSCNTELETSLKSDADAINTEAAKVIGPRVIRLAIEVPYSVYTRFGMNIVSTRAYLESLLNVNALIFKNDSINMVLQSIYIWTTPDYLEYSQQFGQWAVSEIALKQPGTVSILLNSVFNHLHQDEMISAGLINTALLQFMVQIFLPILPIRLRLKL